MPILPPHKVTDDTYVLPSYLPVPDLPVPGFGHILVNSYLIKSREPILVDAGMPVVKEEFLQSLWSLIDPQDLRWIFLTHDDGDHTGALMEVLAAAPQAKLITQFVGLARLETCLHLPVERMRILNPGDKFSAGDRELGVLRPPLFDSPATSALFDSKTGMLVCADSFGSVTPEVALDAADIPEPVLYDGFYLFNRLNHPWFSLVDQSKFDKVLEGIRRLQPKFIGSCHCPLVRGAQVETHLKAMAKIPSMGPLDLPDQAALEAILAKLQGVAAHHG